MNEVACTTHTHTPVTVDAIMIMWKSPDVRCRHPPAQPPGGGGLLHTKRCRLRTRASGWQAQRTRWRGTGVHSYVGCCASGAVGWPQGRALTLENGRGVAFLATPPPAPWAPTQCTTSGTTWCHWWCRHRRVNLPGGGVHHLPTQRKSARFSRRAVRTLRLPFCLNSILLPVASRRNPAMQPRSTPLPSARHRHVIGGLATQRCCPRACRHQRDLRSSRPSALAAAGSQAQPVGDSVRVFLLHGTRVGAHGVLSCRAQGTARQVGAQLGLHACVTRWACMHAHCDRAARPAGFDGPPAASRQPHHACPAPHAYAGVAASDGRRAECAVWATGCKQGGCAERRHRGCGATHERQNRG